MRTCDSTCQWCARHFFKWLKQNMHNADRDGGRSGGGARSSAASTSIGADSSQRYTTQGRGVIG